MSVFVMIVTMMTMLVELLGTVLALELVAFTRNRKNGESEKHQGKSFHRAAS